jgi:deoxyribodipyrimidine photolyase-related protein
MGNNIFLLLGNQLFDPKILKDQGCERVFMAEDYGLCTYEKHHKLKIYLYLCAMREYKDELQRHGIQVDYFSLEARTDKLTYIEFFINFLNREKIDSINIFEIENKFFEKKVLTFLEEAGVEYDLLATPMFLFSRKEFDSLHGKNKSFRLGNFYKVGRKKFNILVDNEGNPLDGRWSFDEENRKKIPVNTNIPELPKFGLSKYHDAIATLVEKYFFEHPGSTKNVWFPVTRLKALELLDDFLIQRLENFGAYEDAMLKDRNFLFHSCISALLNIGLITPDIVIEKALDLFKQNKAPLNSIEGFVRQILGWREFVRGIYQLRGAKQKKSNFWGHQRKLSQSWYDGSTGLLPLDDCINTAVKDGYSHHIPRLMVICNLMNMCEINPKYTYKWFMEMYIDASDWVMIPNVFGMATYSDGGLMSTKPYTCSSNYILKMSNYERGAWCDVIDGLYWRFIEKNIDFYSSNPRLSFQTRVLSRMSEDRKTLIFKKAEEFLVTHTV